jgi:uncharacterized protein
MAPDVVVRDAPESHRYEASVGGELAGFAEYHDRAGTRVFVHTEVLDAYEGEGVGSALARGALDDVAAAGRRVKAVCPFIAAYIQRHPAYEGLLVDAAG